MKALFLLLGQRNQASSRVRGFWVMEELEKLGVKCVALSGSERIQFVKAALMLPFFDSIVFQKRYSRWDFYLLRIANLLGKRTVFDIDDKYSRTNSPKTKANVVRIMRCVSAVTVGSKELLNFAKEYQSKSFYLPTSVKLDNYRPTKKEIHRTSVTFGWIGNGKHYYRDLISVLKIPLTNVAQEIDIRLKLVGTCGQKELLEEFSGVPGLSLECIDQIDWGNPEVVSSTIADFDIGLYPLQATDVNRFKCGFKALEYMAMGLPVVASPVGSNNYIIRDGISGYLAKDANAWTMALSALAKDPDKRISMGSQGKRIVEENYDVAIQARLLLTLLRNG